MPRQDPDPALAVKVAAELAALHDMGIVQLREQYLQLFGGPTLSRNATWLRRKLAWRIQELAYGGLSDAALAKIDDVLDWMDEHHVHPVGEKKRIGGLPPRTRRVIVSGPTRDPRLPPAGTVLTRDHGGVEHTVTVGETTFEYAGVTFGSLSQIATTIAGGRRNGFRHFGLKEPWADRVFHEEQGAA